MDGIELALLTSRAQAICDEMGVLLRRSAFSPNIKDRLDFSCALFDARGDLFAQAAHIPVHLGSMAFAMRDLVGVVDWRPDDVLVVNDPFLGGTHLPDVTIVVPVWCDGAHIGFAVNRAHHADIGADTPGSMPLSRSLSEEGVVIPPMLLEREGRVPDAAAGVLRRLAAAPDLDIDRWRAAPRLADFAAQVASARAGARALAVLARTFAPGDFQAAVDALGAYAERLARSTIRSIPDGILQAEDLLDSDGFGHDDLPLRVQLRVEGDEVAVDFAGTHAQVEGNLNCALPVAAAAVFYVFRCLMPRETPASAGAFRPIHLQAPPGCLLNARRPAAVAAGNVETSMRVVDVLLRALAPALPERIPAAAQGTMNNVAMGARGRHRWDYYETIAGGLGAHAAGPGPSAVQAHMTNTLNTPVESLEAHYPLRVERYAVRRNSGGAGRHRGGDGVIRSYRFLEDAQVTLLGERHRHAPWGLAGGVAGAPARALLNGQPLPGKCCIAVRAGDLLEIHTPGGGGWGTPDDGS
ncbi:MAG: hydantoinase B/oxoprolinase family protein [Pseudomonadales bacterium]|jgi:N-methylhydantoinase B|nr:hydantoinase B/oxoprolinase family protein [Pseudomonadales bacterium]